MRLTALAVTGCLAALSSAATAQQPSTDHCSTFATAYAQLTRVMERLGAPNRTFSPSDLSAFAVTAVKRYQAACANDPSKMLDEWHAMYMNVQFNVNDIYSPRAITPYRLPDWPPKDSCEAYGLAKAGLHAVELELEVVPLSADGLDAKGQTERCKAMRRDGMASVLERQWQDSYDRVSLHLPRLAPPPR